MGRRHDNALPKVIFAYPLGLICMLSTRELYVTMCLCVCVCAGQGPTGSRTNGKLVPNSWQSQGEREEVGEMREVYVCAATFCVNLTTS